MPDVDRELTTHEAAAAAVVDTLRSRRESFGLSQRELGARSGVSAPMICEYEARSVLAPGPPAIMALADALGCDLVLAPRETYAGDLQRAVAEIADLRARLVLAKTTRQWPVDQEMPRALVGTQIQPWHLQAVAAYDTARGEATPVRGHGRYRYTAPQINEAIDWWNLRIWRGEAGT
jgi:transcriptional regulator with XRE-family HTH domain